MSDFHTSRHHVIPRGDQIVSMYGVFSHDRTVSDDFDGEPTGQECTLVFTLSVSRQLLDVGVVRVGFMGADNGDLFSLDVPGSYEYRTGLWDLLFPIRRSSPEEETRHSYKGSFYVETADGTYYWLKYLGESDFTFDYASLPTLGSLVPASP